MVTTIFLTAVKSISPRNTMLMGVMGFDGFVYAQYERDGPLVKRYGGEPHRNIALTLVGFLAAVSMVVTYATRCAAKGNEASASFIVADAGYGFIFSMLLMAIAAAVLDTSGLWYRFMYDTTTGTLLHHRILVEKPRPFGTASMVALQLIAWVMATFTLVRFTRHRYTIKRQFGLTAIILVTAGSLILFLSDVNDNHCDGLHTTVVYATACAAWAGTTLCMQWMTIPIKTKRYPDGMCQRCGYDLRGTIAAGRTECPECGEKFEAQQKPTA